MASDAPSGPSGAHVDFTGKMSYGDYLSLDGLLVSVYVALATFSLLHRCLRSLPSSAQSWAWARRFPICFLWLWGKCTEIQNGSDGSIRCGCVDLSRNLRPLPLDTVRAWLVPREPLVAKETNPETAIVHMNLT